jgi:hypothetical protein
MNDPDALLAEIRALIRASGVLSYARLAEAVDQLDRHITGGGELPEIWRGITVHADRIRRADTTTLRYQSEWPGPHDMVPGRSRHYSYAYHRCLCGWRVFVPRTPEGEAAAAAAHAGHLTEISAP